MFNQEQVASIKYSAMETCSAPTNYIVPQVTQIDKELRSAGSNTNAGGIGSLEMLRNSSPQFRAFLALVQSRPHILQPMLQELGKQNPQIWHLIQENQAEFLCLINEAPEGAEGILTSIPSNAGGIDSLEMLRNISPQFRVLLALVQARPHILQPMLQELGKQNPQILRLIQDNQAEFLRLINEALEGAEEDFLGQLSAMPQTVPSVGSNANAGGIGILEMLRNSSPQFRALLALVQSSPQILQPMLQELGKQNPQIWHLIRENQAEFLRLINVAPEGAEGDLQGQLANTMPRTIEVTSEEREALERLEAMGFDRALVLEVFFACNKNEELATNFLLAHMHEFEDEQQQ